jgi:sugar-specific transcriptional regulator TrmB
MVAESVILNSLKNVMSVNSYEAKIYTALLSRGISSASELADISHVPRSRCYDVLESLEKKGFVFMKIGKPIKYIAVPPEEVLETLKKGTRIEENRVVALMDSVKESDIYSELSTLYSAGINYIDNSEISTSVVGRQNINLFLKEMLSRAQGSVIIHTTEQGVKRKAKIAKKAVGKSVKVQIHSHTHKSPAKTLPHGMRFVKVDEDELLFFTSPEEVHPDIESAVWIKSKFIADSIKSLIE